MVTTLVRLGFDDPESLAVELEALGAWPPRPGANGHRLLEELAASANPTLATRALAAIAQATSDPGAFAAGLRRRPALRRRLIAVVAASRSLGRWLAAHPDEVERLGDGRALAAPRPRAELVRQARAAVPASAGVEAGWRGLRRFRRRELLRVAVRDLDGGAPVDSVGAELANLADACLQAGLELATRAQAAPGDPPVGLAVLAMGKLGGRELNYVSDIDVLFCHEPATGADAELAGKLAGAIARELIAGLGGPNPEGPGFQVDPNLRPEGRNGPLTRTLGSYLAYWERWVEPWELQALIKVRPAAGDRRLGERFVAEAARRVYPERFDPATVTAVRHMKARVESSRAARAGGELQVKLGPGGLRDIEFAVQLLQLVHGRHDPALRSGTTLVALERLTAAGFVGRADAAQLADAYRFLRTVEHRLQLTDERRTHTIPAGEAERRWLARTMGYPDGGPGGGGARPRPWDHGSHAEPSVSPPVRSPREGALERFEADRRRHAATVRGLHEKLFYRPLLEVFGAVPSGLDPSNAAERLAALGFANPDRAMAHLRALTAGLTRRATLLRAMLPVMLTWLADTPDPDGGLTALRVVAERLGHRDAFFGTLRDNPSVAELVCTVLGTSRLLGELLARHPELLTAMAHEGGPGPAGDPAELRDEALALVAHHEQPAAAFDALRRFRRRELLRVAVRDLAGGDPVERVGAELTAVAEACLEAALEVAVRAVVPGRPRLQLAVLGLGNLGGRELNYVSDLDVIVCHAPVGGGRAQQAAQLAEAVVRELIAGLGAVTPEGTAFRVDLGLRPEGRNGPLSRSLDSYLAYWDRWAEPWERQAMVRLRPVAGSRELGERFHAEATRRVYPERPAPGMVAAVRRVEAGWLTDAYRLCLRLRNLGFLVTGRPADSLPTDPLLLERLAEAMGEPVGGRQRLLEAYRRATRRARRVVMARFWGER